jgi:hypothetical protein
VVWWWLEGCLEGWWAGWAREKGVLVAASAPGEAASPRPPTASRSSSEPLEVSGEDATTNLPAAAKKQGDGRR